MKKFYNILTLLFVLFAATSCSNVIMEDQAEMPSHEKTTLVRIGDTAPDFTVQTLSGEKQTLSSMQGKTVLLVFFATSCPDCEVQLDLLNSVISLFDTDKFEILAISRGEKITTVSKFISKKDYNFTIGVDRDKSIYSLYATQYIPRCFVIDPLGHIEAISVEYDKEEFEKVVEVIRLLLTL